MVRSAAVILGALALASCTTTTEIPRPGGQSELLIACGAATGWNVCHKEAAKRCPTGYETVRQDGGINRKELIISCPAASK